jgi:hypothetical protein
MGSLIGDLTFADRVSVLASFHIYLLLSLEETVYPFGYFYKVMR